MAQWEGGSGSMAQWGEGVGRWPSGGGGGEKEGGAARVVWNTTASVFTLLQARRVILQEAIEPPRAGPAAHMFILISTLSSHRTRLSALSWTCGTTAAPS